MKVKNNGCCDLEYVKKLKELGVKQESLWWWEYDMRYSNLKRRKDFPDNRTWGLRDFKIDDDCISAFTVAELGEMLLEGCASYRLSNNKYSCSLNEDWNFDIDSYENKEEKDQWWSIKHEKVRYADTEANARAEMFIWLIEQGKCLNIIQKIKGKMPKVAIGGKS